MGTRGEAGGGEWGGLECGGRGGAVAQRPRPHSGYLSPCERWASVRGVVFARHGLTDSDELSTLLPARSTPYWFQPPAYRFTSRCEQLAHPLAGRHLPGLFVDHLRASER